MKDWAGAPAAIRRAVDCPAGAETPLSRKGDSWAAVLEFDDPDRVERLKVIEYISQIESYRREVAQIDGLQLSGEQAAREWVKRYAGEFSALN